MGGHGRDSRRGPGRAGGVGRSRVTCGRARPHGSQGPRPVASRPMLLAAKTAAQEGKEVIEAMLVVGLIFLGVILLGELSKWRRHRR